jgi:hypothetical protein
MAGRSALRALTPMTDEARFDRLDERVEHIVDQISALRTEVRVQHAELRSEMIDRSAHMLKWLLGFFVAQTAALGALMAAFR